jgi:multicomponent Na+:H+ antiporter subunit F
MTRWIFTALVLVALMLLAMVRLFKGPTAADRVVALDAINTLVVAAMIVLAVVFRQFIFVDVAIIYALLAFVGTLYIAKLPRRRNCDPRHLIWPRSPSASRSTPWASPASCAFPTSTPACTPTQMHHFGSIFTRRPSCSTPPANI